MRCSAILPPGILLGRCNGEKALACASQLDALALLATASLGGRLSAMLHERGVMAVLITLMFALIAYRVRGVDLSGAIAGAVLSFLVFISAGPAGFTVVAVVFALAAFTTRLGDAHKRRLGLAERKRGRNGWQVAANVAVGAICAVGSLYAGHWRDPLLLAAVGALGEAAADTVSSEVGQAFTRHVYLITTFCPVSVGTDGGISAIGTASAGAAAVIVALIAHWTHLIPTHWIAAAAGAAMLGTFVDSVLGATLQRWGWLNNSGVNLLSTAAAAGIALLFLV